MDSSLKDLESRLEKLTPRGMSDDGMARCETLIDELAQLGSEEGGASSPVGWSWQVTSVAAAVTLLVGLVAGRWMGQSDVNPSITDLAEEPEFLSSAFEIIDERSWLQLDGAPEVIFTLNGEVREIGTEVDVSEETVLHRDSGNYITRRVLTHQPIEMPTNQF